MFADTSPDDLRSKPTAERALQVPRESSELGTYCTLPAELDRRAHRCSCCSVLCRLTQRAPCVCPHAGLTTLEGTLEGVSNAQPATAELQAWLMNGGEASMTQINTLLARRAALRV